MDSPIVRNTVRRDVNGRIGLGNGIAYRPAGVVVVAGGVGEGPGIRAIRTSRRVRGAGQVQTTQSFTQHTRGGSRSRVRSSRVINAVWRDVDGRVGFGDDIIH